MNYAPSDYYDDDSTDRKGEAASGRGMQRLSLITEACTDMPIPILVYGKERNVEKTPLLAGREGCSITTGCKKLTCSESSPWKVDLFAPAGRRSDRRQVVAGGSTPPPAAPCGLSGRPLASHDRPHDLAGAGGICTMRHEAQRRESKRRYVRPVRRR